MTTKDIRDIAAYWGAPVKYEHSILGPKSGVVNWATMMIIQGQFVGEGKLQLRNMMRLTEEEFKHCAYLAGLKTDEYEVERIRDSFKLKLAHFHFDPYTSHCPFFVLVGSYKGVPRNYPEIIAYLQSIHVYVPGTVDEKYVELV